VLATVRDRVTATLDELERDAARPAPDPGDDQGPEAGEDEPEAGEDEPAVSEDEPVADADEAGVRLIALNMALSGTPREETARYLREQFELADPDRLLDDVYERAGG
jgi:hypothetical protein